MDRSRIITTLGCYFDDGENENQLKRRAHHAANELRLDVDYEGAVQNAVQAFFDEVIARQPELQRVADELTYAFRVGLELDLSIGAVGEPDWEL